LEQNRSNLNIKTIGSVSLDGKSELISAQRNKIENGLITLDTCSHVGFIRGFILFIVIFEFLLFFSSSFFKNNVNFEI
jgi:hypothetical protein